MKYLKTFLENVDTPDLVNKFSRKDLRTAAWNDSPYDVTKSMMRFQNGLHMGKAGKSSAELQDMMHDSEWGRVDSKFAISDYMYKHVIDIIPEFKDYDYKVEDESGKLGISFRKKQRVKGTKFNYEISLWLAYHTKYYKILGYEKGKIKPHFYCGLEDLDQQFRKSPIIIDEDKVFKDVVIELIDKHPDKKYPTGISVYGRNFTKETFLKTLPRIKKDLNFFKFVIDQATFEYQKYLYTNNFARFYKLIMLDDDGQNETYDDIHPKILAQYKDQIPRKIRLINSTTKFGL